MIARAKKHLSEIETSLLNNSTDWWLELKGGELINVGDGLIAGHYYHYPANGGVVCFHGVFEDRIKKIISPKRFINNLLSNTNL